MQKTQVSETALFDLIRGQVDPYTEFRIPKGRNGALRIIAAPSRDLGKLQRSILDNILSAPQRASQSFAYHRGVSVTDCARVHSPARWLVKLDLKDFFGSVSAVRVAAAFTSIGLTEEFSSQLAFICTRRAGEGGARFLPQGAPTSGLLANLVAAALDESLVLFARHLNLRYSRYSDDLIFSSSGTFSRSKALRIVRQVRSKVAAHGFTLNEDKIRIRPPGSRLLVLGMLVDSEYPRLRHDFKRLIEWHVYGAERFGIAEYSASRGFTSIESYLRHVDGLLAHALDVQPDWAAPLRQKWNFISSAPAGRLLGPPREVP
ncbi:reverse transcriptase family protein [Arthrobacter sp. MDT3-44]